MEKQFFGSVVLPVVFMTMLVISCVDAFTTDQVLIQIDDMYTYGQLDMYPDTASLKIKNHFKDFVRKYHKKYDTIEEIQLRYELFKLRVMRDRYYDQYSDLTKLELSKLADNIKKHLDTMTTGNGKRVVIRHDIEKEEDEEDQVNITRLLPNISYNETYVTTPATRENERNDPNTNVKGRDMMLTEENTDLTADIDSNKFRILSTNKSIQLILNNSTVIFKTLGDPNLVSNDPNMFVEGVRKDECKTHESTKATPKVTKATPKVKYVYEYVTETQRPTMREVTWPQGVKFAPAQE